MGEDMSGDGEQPAPAAVWARVRERYENGIEAVTTIANDAGITRQALAARARLEGWKLRGVSRGKPQGTRATLARFKALLQQRLSEFEAQIGTLSAEANAATSERDIRAMNTLVRTLTVGAGGYIGGRSLEKVADAVKAPKRAGFPFIRGSDRKG